jgi:hypothetical protein
MKLNFRKSTKPAKVPRLGWTIFMGFMAVAGFSQIFDPSISKTITDKLSTGVFCISLALWTILRIQQMTKFEIKLRKRPHLAMTIFIFMAGMMAFIEVFSSTFTTSNNQTFTDKFLWFCVGLSGTLWAALRLVYAKGFEKAEI